MRVVFFHRKARQGNFSIEGLFNQIRQAMPVEVEWEVKELSYFSKGFFKRLYIGLEAAFNQRDVNHITGDVNFIALFLNKRKTVLTMHDVGFMKHPNVLSRFLLHWFWIILPVRCSSFITTVSEATKNEMLKYVKVDPAKIKVIYVPISEAFVSSPKAFNHDKPVILQIGTKFNKNVRRLVRALQGIPCKLEIVGSIDRDLENELKKSTFEFEIFLNLSNPQIVERYCHADIVSFVSTYEGFGMPIVEANAVGRIVVTSNILSMPEIAGDAAHLVDPYDESAIREGILKVINDNEYRDQLIRNGFVNKLRFNDKEIARQYVQVYKSIVGE